MPSLWLTYDWDDNKDKTIDFIAQELGKVGVTVKLDRQHLQAGKLLWDQIGKFIQDLNETDGWAIYLTSASVVSPACREELAYALDRALSTRGNVYPLIGLFPSTYDPTALHPSIRARLCVTTTDPDWKERIKSSLEGRAPSIPRPMLAPYSVGIHPPMKPGAPHTIEIRPLAGTWAPFFVGFPVGEKGLFLSLSHGPKGHAPMASMLMAPVPDEFMSADGQWWMKVALNEATPTQSYYVQVSQIPSEIAFGVDNGAPQYSHKFR